MEYSSELLDQRVKSKTMQWNCFYTSIGLFARVWADVLAKNMNVFYLNYAPKLNLSRTQFSFIMIAQYVGWIISMFVSSINNKLFKTSRIISTIYVLFDGIFALLFIAPLLLHNNLFNYWSTWQTLLYCCSIWFLFGIAYPTNKSAIVDMASVFSLAKQRGKNISYLGMSWAFATLIFVPVGYMIDYVDWWLPFLSLGSVCILCSFMVLFIFQDPPKNNNKSSKDVENAANKSTELTMTFKSKVCNLILWSHTFSALACGSIETAISGPWLQDVYGYSISKTGYIGFVIFGGEMLGTLMIACFADKLGVFLFAFLAYSIFLCCALLICFMSLISGDNVGGIYIPIAVNFVYFVGWKIFWSALQVAIAKYSPKNISNRTIFSANHSVTAIGRIPGLILTTHLWDNGNGITRLSFIWIGAIVISSLFWIWLYKDVKNQKIRAVSYSIDKQNNISNLSQKHPKYSLN
eukprot:507811_1